ncbi:MAG: sulfatase [Eudoraea sp.]|nr:sulfatase [Eudoraea sp.]
MRGFLNALIVLLITSAYLACEEDTEMPEEMRPNIIWLVAEDQSPGFFPMYGDSTVSLPNLQALANVGVIFNNAYSPVPVCAPARSALISGMYPTTLGTHNMRTYNAYDTENQPGLGIPSYSPVIPQGVKMFTEYLRRNGYYCTNNSKEDYNFKKTEVAWDDSSNSAHWRNRPKNAPFFSVFNFNVCHESQIWRRGEDELLVSPDSVIVPPYFPDTSVIRHDIAVNYSNLIRLDSQIGEIIKQLREDELYENSIIFFYGDHGGPFPRHKRALYETGVKVPLIIKFRHNKKEVDRDNSLISFIDFAPTVLSLAGIEPPKVMQGKAHFGDYINTGTSEYVFFSSDRFDGMVDRLRAVRSRRYKYIKNFNTDISNALPVSYREQMPMMQKLNELWEKQELDSLQALWFRTPKPEEELYDLQEDPYEFVNLAGREEFQDTLLLLRNVLNEWIKNTNDLGQYPEEELLAKWLPNGEAQRLPPLELEDKAGEIHLISRQKDATIIWKQAQDSTWQFYTDPLANDKSFLAKAVRIGFEDSEILEVEVE